MGVDFALIFLNFHSVTIIVEGYTHNFDCLTGLQEDELIATINASAIPFEGTLADRFLHAALVSLLPAPACEGSTA